MTSTFRTLIFGAALTTLALPLLAQGSDSLEQRLREQLRSSVTQMRDAQAAQASAEAARKAAEAERDALKAKLAAAGKAPKVSAADSQELSRLRAENQRLRSEASNKSSSVDLANGQIASLQQQVAQLVSERNAAQATLANRGNVEQELRWGVATCATRNDQLVSLANDLVAEYEKAGPFTRLRRSEPFLKLQKVAQQNQAQAWGDKVYALKFDPYRERAPLAALTTNSGSPAGTVTNP